MEDIIRQIIAIDKTAKDIVNNNESEIKNKGETARHSLEQLKADLVEKAREQGLSIYNEKLQGAEEEARQILENNRKEMEALESHYRTIRLELESAIFKKVFLEAGEESSIP